MGKLLQSQLYVMLHSRACVILLLAALLLTALIYRDNGDVMDEREMARYKETCFAGKLSWKGECLCPRFSPGSPSGL